MNLVSNFAHVPVSPVNPQTQAVAHDNKVREIIRQPAQTEGFPREPGIAKDQEQQRPQTKDNRQRLVASDNAFESLDTVENESEEGIEAIGDSSQEQGEERGENTEQQQRQAEREQTDQQQAIEQQEIDALEARDREVIAHEQTHSAVGGQYAGAPKYSYERGPDGVLYAVSGEVSIDVSPVPNDPVATIRKMRQIQAAATAPAEPSAQDRRVAQEAVQLIAEAQAQIAAGDTGDDEAYQSNRRRFSEAVADATQNLQGQDKETLQEEKQGPLSDKQTIAQMAMRNAVIADTYQRSSLSSAGILIGSV
ncbi:hypothetical protein K0504_09385 [Neiella marina]|uniref:SprA-related family protein n=1 Tax=Neiella holothuriorum TaxID=2870530 RepID=A0ABS7EFZ7_9GAMM|nr:putative metalloprotease CJM1_0395 family protein [Neiella holothuriorum]MBW8191248.1 hypothetical protein [Neiella holothuriorum]